jgi:hypothetical protein
MLSPEAFDWGECISAIARLHSGFLVGSIWVLTGFVPFLKWLFALGFLGSFRRFPVEQEFEGAGILAVVAGFVAMEEIGGAGLVAEGAKGVGGGVIVFLFGRAAHFGLESGLLDTQRRIRRQWATGMVSTQTFSTWLAGSSSASKAARRSENAAGRSFSRTTVLVSRP